jgi:hypothetical protein
MPAEISTVVLCDSVDSARQQNAQRTVESTMLLALLLAIMRPQCADRPTLTKANANVTHFQRTRNVSVTGILAVVLVLPVRCRNAESVA